MEEPSPGPVEELSPGPVEEPSPGPVEEPSPGPVEVSSGSCTAFHLQAAGHTCVDACTADALYHP